MKHKSSIKIPMQLYHMMRAKHVCYIILNMKAKVYPAQLNDAPSRWF